MVGKVAVDSELLRRSCFLDARISEGMVSRGIQGKFRRFVLRRISLRIFQTLIRPRFYSLLLIIENNYYSHFFFLRSRVSLIQTNIFNYDCRCLRLFDLGIFRYILQFL